MKNGRYTGEELGISWLKFAWYKDDKFHREDDPAVEWSNGHKEWYFNGELHRLDGPARECIYGTKEWYFNGQLHREDGPAVEHANGHKYWYYYDEEIKCQSQSEFEKIIKLLAFR